VSRDGCGKSTVRRSLSLRCNVNLGEVDLADEHLPVIAEDADREVRTRREVDDFARVSGVACACGDQRQRLRRDAVDRPRWAKSQRATDVLRMREDRTETQLVDG